jgi:GTP-binding protein
MSAYPDVRFLTSANAVPQLPADTGVEVAIAGRSNAGKSSAINAITQRKGLARTSKTPGATRLINFFELEPGRRLVDLPGYGFAAVSGSMREHWGALLEAYFATRQSLQGAVVVMDIRHPLTAHDQDMLALTLGRKVPVHILLTKADKLSRGAAAKVLAGARRDVARMAGVVTVQVFSAHAGDGVAAARGAIERLLDGKPAQPEVRSAEKETPVGSADPTGAS